MHPLLMKYRAGASYVEKPQQHSLLDVVECSQHGDAMLFRNSGDLGIGDACEFFDREAAISVIQYLIDRAFDFSWPSDSFVSSTCDASDGNT